MQSNTDTTIHYSRREFVGHCAAAAMTSGISSSVCSAELTTPVAVHSEKPPQTLARAKHVIYLFMSGGPSQLDLLDPKPILNQRNSEPIPESFVKDKRFAFVGAGSQLLGSYWKFGRHGDSGAEVSELLPNFSRVVDDVSIIRSMRSESFNHAPGIVMMHTGSALPGRPSIGAWLSYALGTQTKNMPGFVVLHTSDGGGVAAVTANGFLPPKYQGTLLRSGGEPLLYIGNPPGVDLQCQRRTVETINQLNELQIQHDADDAITSRMDAYDTAVRMQQSAPELTNLAAETAETLKLYGIGESDNDKFARNCLLARRLVERGVRFVQLLDHGWDHHRAIRRDLPNRCGRIDRAMSGLLVDLKRRGLLDETLVVWGGEFGRTPMREVRGTIGRDHHPDAFSMWMAGGGIKPGQTIGMTDDLGFNVVERPVTFHDLHATILKLVGVEHKELTYRYQGRDFRLTDVHGRVIDELIA